MFLRYLSAEILKLKRSLALLLCVTAPMLVATISVLIVLRNDRVPDMEMFWSSASAIWAFAMLPLSVTALSVLLAQSEHGPRTWDHLLPLPGARPRLFLAKGAVMLGCVAGMSLLLGMLIWGGGEMVMMLRDTKGALDPAALFALIGKMAVAATLLSIVQLWVALRFRSFVPPLALGIAGTFTAVAAAGAEEGAYFPWLMPLHMLAQAPGGQQTALLLGSLGGLVALGAMVLDFQFREAR
jgi:ABC-2 type transport system permease protein